jgi:hypothetical protein
VTAWQATERIGPGAMPNSIDPFALPGILVRIRCALDEFRLLEEHLHTASHVIEVYSSDCPVFSMSTAGGGTDGDQF